MLACLPALGPPTHAESPAAGGSDQVKKRFIGNWELLPNESSFEGPRATTGRGFVGGRIMYDERGHMAAQLMRGGRPRIAPESTDAEQATQGYIAYYGTYEIDPAKGTVTHHVEGSTNTNWVGTALVRYFTFSDDGDRLTLKMKNEDRVAGTLAWTRLR